MTENAFCGIPARAGSKRVPGKNLTLLNGKPMIAYSIEAAIASGVFSKVFVCTEDQVTARVARDFGAEVPTLVPTELCGDLVASHVPCQYVMNYLANQGECASTLVCLQPTSPLRTPNEIRDALNCFTSERYDFLVSVTRVDPHYFHWAVSQQEGGDWQLIFGSKYLLERPLLPPIYRPNGSIKIAHAPALRSVGHFFGPRLGVLETPEETSVHVGSQLDLDFCRFLLSASRA